MKSITEFQPTTLQKILATKNTLAAEGKSAEEISAAIGETFKYEGDKIKYALAAAELAKDQTSIRRVLVATFGEGETPAANYQQVEDTYYKVETFSAVKAAPAEKVDPRNARRGGGGKREGGPKGSPWGMTPEEKAAKSKSAPKA